MHAAREIYEGIDEEALDRLRPPGEQIDTRKSPGPGQWKHHPSPGDFLEVNVGDRFYGLHSIVIHFAAIFRTPPSARP